MLIRKPADLRHSDVTPKDAYINRRRFLAAGSAIAGAWALPGSADAAMKLDNVAKSAYKVDEKVTVENVEQKVEEKEKLSSLSSNQKGAPKLAKPTD